MKSLENIPAFPVMHSIDGNWAPETKPEFRGMTLLDYFAGQALIGICANPNTKPTFTSDDYAAYSYNYATAMLKARKAVLSNGEM